MILYSLIGGLSLTKPERRAGPIVRLAVTGALGLGLALVSVIRFDTADMNKYLGSAWMVPTICLTMFACVVIDHIGLPKKKVH